MCTLTPPDAQAPGQKLAGSTRKIKRRRTRCRVQRHLNLILWDLSRLARLYQHAIGIPRDRLIPDSNHVAIVGIGKDF